MKILLVEDDEVLSETLKSVLTRHHYQVEATGDGESGWQLAEMFEYDLILLDLMLPKLDGISFCQRLRARSAVNSTLPNARTPILLLTAQDSSTKRVAGLDAGADDYVVKPFDLNELLARIRALLRRRDSTASPLIRWGCLQLDPSTCEVRWADRPVHLTAKEYELLEILLRNPHRIFSQSVLIERLWSSAEIPTENTVRAHIKALRQKLKKVGAADPIETVYGLGYRLRQQVESPMGSDPDGPAQLSPSPSQPSSDPLQLTSDGRLRSQLAAIWSRHRGTILDRVREIEAAIAALQANQLTPEQRQTAHQHAHTLIGTLGSLGFEAAPPLARQLEQRFKGSASLPASDAEGLTQLVQRLRQLLEPEAVSAAAAPIALTANHWSTRPTAHPSTRLLIVDDDEVLIQAIRTTALAAGMEVSWVTSLTDARQQVACEPPDVVLLDLTFPDPTDSGYHLLAELSSRQPPVPVVVFTSREGFDDRVRVARLGGKVFLQKPVAPPQVMDAIRRTLQQSQQPEARLLIVDDDRQVLELLHTLLRPWGFYLTLLSDPCQFWPMLEQVRPDLLILDIEFSLCGGSGSGQTRLVREIATENSVWTELNGIDLCQVVRNDPDWANLPILFLSAHQDADTVHRVFMAGADDYITKPIIGPELVARILNRLERNQMTRSLQ